MKAVPGSARAFVSLASAVQARADDDLNLDTEDAPEDEAEADDSKTNGHGLPWEGSDRDYVYEELLGELQTALGTTSSS